MCSHFSAERIFCFKADIVGQWSALPFAVVGVVHFFAQVTGRPTLVRCPVATCNLVPVAARIPHVMGFVVEGPIEAGFAGPAGHEVSLQVSIAPLT